MESPHIQYGNGWYSEESDGISTFRWMRGEARCHIKNYQFKGKKYLRFTAGHPFLTQKPLILEVFINGQKKGEREMESAFCSYAFSFEERGDIEFKFKLNKTFQIPDDDRNLGIMVRKMEILSPDSPEIFLEGWYSEEYPPSAKEPLRWMKQKAKCIFAPVPKEKETYIGMEAGHPFEGIENPILSVSSKGKILGEREIFFGENKYLIPVDPCSEVLEVEFNLNKVFTGQFSGDARKLGIMVKKLEIFVPEKENVIYESGWHEWEKDGFFSFRWMSQKATVFLPLKLQKRNKYISFYIYSDFADFSQKLTLSLGEKVLSEIPLLNSWNYYSFSLHHPWYPFQQAKKDKQGNEKSPDKLKTKNKNEMILSINKTVPEEYHPDDRRDLGVRVSGMEFHDHDQNHENFLFFYKNAYLNYTEMREGKTKLSSYPQNLGIDLYGRCNIKPPCVYCMWDLMKESEGKYVEATVDEKTLASYGPFFRAARSLINCSIGEPLLHPRLKEILDFCQKNNKFMEISTNGQAFTSRAIKALAGKFILLYISLDAACKETYAKIRNDRWDSIIPQLELLNQERKKHGNLPKIFMIFMPMRVNRDDLEDYFRLCQKIEADYLVLRPLFYSQHYQIEADRGGYHFNYKNEYLTYEELLDIFHKCEGFSKKYGIPVINQFTFGMAKKPEQERKDDLLAQDQHF